jgi:hypothetical protein
VAGHLVRRACQRHLDDLEHGPSRGLTFDQVAATRAIEFFSSFLRHANGQSFTLAPFQQFIVGSLHGWRAAGVRRFRHLFFEAAKGSGKSPLASGLALCSLFLDEEAGSEGFCAAVTREQARIQFMDCVRMAQGSPDLARQLDITDTNIAMPSLGSFIRPVSSEARALDGKRVSVALIDELMEHPNADVYDKMRAGTKTRRQPLIIVTTNSGYDRIHGHGEEGKGLGVRNRHGRHCGRRPLLRGLWLTAGAGPRPDRRVPQATQDGVIGRLVHRPGLSELQSAPPPALTGTRTATLPRALKTRMVRAWQWRCGSLRGG